MAATRLRSRRRRQNGIMHIYEMEADLPYQKNNMIAAALHRYEAKHLQPQTKRTIKAWLDSTDILKCRAFKWKAARCENIDCQQK